MFYQDSLQRSTLCWHCANATGNCSWSRYGEQTPVPGWTAIRRDMHDNHYGTIESYCVIKCPEFQPDRKKVRE